MRGNHRNFFFLDMYAIFLDIETTGLDPFIHKPIDLAFKIYDIRQDVSIAEYQQKIFQSIEDWNLHDPESIKVNGYTYRDLEEGKRSEKVAEEVIQLLLSHGIERGKAFFICQNPAFDRAFFDRIIPVYTQEKLNWPYHWLDLASMYWVFLLNEEKNERSQLSETINLSKNAIGKRFGIEQEAVPHRAMNGVEHLIKCYRAVISSFSG